jgi:membrane protein DedA with SNARE-associated domain/membrane-associated phospholipid phosphatase
VQAHLQALIAYLSGHASLALAMVFAASLLESVAVIGIFIPGSTLVFAGGVLIGLGILSPGWTAGAAISGAILGDGFSFWLGRRYHEGIRTMSLFKRYATLFKRGEDYFATRGASSIFIARFLGPVRAIVPVVAGMSDMSPVRFYTVNGVSALAWAAAHLVPGTLFGASLQLAGAISSRLAILLLLLVVGGWLLWKAVQLAYSQLAPAFARARDRVVLWARSGSHLQHRVTLALFDPERAESPALLAAAVMLVAGTWLFLGVLEDVLSGDPLVRFDHAAFTSLQSLRTPWVDGLMVAITEVGSVRVAVPVIGAVALLLAIKRCWRTLAYWFAAVVFAQALVWVLKLSVARTRPSAIYAGIEQYSFPSGHATSAIVLYGFLAFLLLQGRSARWKVAGSAIAVGLILLIAFSRLYLGAHWFSDVLAGLSVGLAWVSLLAIAYTHHVRETRLRTSSLAVTSLGVLLLASAIQIGTQHAMDVVRYRAQPAAVPTLLDNWFDTGWRTLPAYRTEVDGDAEDPVVLQWVATSTELMGALAGAGWTIPPPWTFKDCLLWLLPHPPIEKLPVLPKLNHDNAQAITLSKLVDAQSRLVVRFWLSGREGLAPSTDHPKEIWLGTVTLERLIHPAAAFTIARSDPDFVSALHALEKDLESRSLANAWRARDSAPVLLVW